MRLYSFFLTAHWFGAMCAGPVSCYTQITYNGCKRGKGERRKKERNSFHSLRPCWCPPQTLDLDSPFGGDRFTSILCDFPPSNDQFYPFYTSLLISTAIVPWWLLPLSLSIVCRRTALYTGSCCWTAPGLLREPCQEKILRSQVVVLFPPFFFSSLFYIFLRLGHSRLLYRLEWLWK
jgi:hypothetical protein